METVKLYTRQHENSYYELQNKGQMTNKEIYVTLHAGADAPYFRDRYGTFVKMAEKRIPRPEGIEYPIWCSVSKRNCLKPIEKELVYCLSVPKDQVIYFDGTKWDYVLNYLYLPKDDKDKKDFEQLVKKLGVKDEFNFIRGKYAGMFPDVEEKIRKSWERIFDIDDWSDFKVQANLWRIKKEWVRHIVRPGEDLFAIDTD